MVYHTWMGTRGASGRLLASLALLLLGLVPASPAATGPAPLVYQIEVAGPIDLGLAPYLERVLADAAAAPAAGIIIRLETPGGRVDAAIRIRDALLGAEVPTFAFVDREAYSAGALVALAANRIYMAPGSVIGAAAPVDVAGQPAGEKAVSAVRKLFRATAETRGRPPEAAEAMVDADVDFPPLAPRGKLLTLSAAEAVAIGVADGQVADRAALLDAVGLAGARVVAPSPNWAERLLRLLTNPIVQSLLLSVGMIGLIAELYSPGFGVAGGLGLTALALYFGGQYVVGLVGWEEVLLLGLGALLLALEAFVIPGFGVAGLLGILALATGLFLSLVGRFPSPGDFARAGWVLLGALGVTVVGVVVLSLLAPATPLFRRLRLATVLGPERPAEPAPAAEEPGPGWVGREGRTVTDLRPSGFAAFDAGRVEVLSEGPFIPGGRPVVVVRMAGTRPVVREKEVT